MNGFLRSFRFEIVEMTQRDAVRWRFSVNNSWNLKTFVRQISVWNENSLKLWIFRGEEKQEARSYFFGKESGKSMGLRVGTQQRGDVRWSRSSCNISGDWVSSARSQTHFFFKNYFNLRLNSLKINYSRQIIFLIF